MLVNHLGSLYDIITTICDILDLSFLPHIWSTISPPPPLQNALTILLNNLSILKRELKF